MASQPSVFEIGSMELQRPLHSSQIRKDLTYRIQGINMSVDISSLQKDLELLLETQDLSVESLAPSSITRQGQVATVRIADSAKLPNTNDEWHLPTDHTLIMETGNNSKRMLSIDTHFLGFTPLYSPASDMDHSLE